MIKNDLSVGYKQRNKRWNRCVIILCAILFFVISISMMYGNTIYSPGTILKVILGENIQGATFTIMSLRLPRTLAGVLVGFAFGMSGYVFQSILRNDLASPDIIGVSSSTSLIAIFCIIFLRFDSTLTSVVSVFAGLITAFIIYSLSSYNGFSQGKMVLIGIGAQAFFRALTNLVLLNASEYDVSSTMQWLSGSLNNVTLDEIPVLFMVVIICGIFLISYSKHLGAIQLGDEYATTLGVNIKTIYPILIGFSVALVAFSTAVTGPIASVAFLSGPIAKRIAGNGKSNIITAGLVGAIIVLLADFVGQNAFAVRYPVGVITGILGAPYLIYLLIKMNQKGQGV